VLVVDDEPLARERMVGQVAQCGATAVAALPDAAEAARWLERQTVDVVLLDISMPGTNGLETIPRIRALDNPPAILMLSMHDEVQIAARALKAGAAGYSTKDSDPALLLTAIRKVASGGRYIDPQLADRMVFEVGLTDSRPAHTQLSEREYQVFERLVHGTNVNEIAQQLNISAKTVSTHKVRLMQKLQAHSVADMVRYAIDHKLI